MDRGREQAWAAVALAMGVQNSTLRRVGRTGVRTTYVSGMLTDFAEEGAAYGLWLRDRTRGRGWCRLRRALRVSPRRGTVRKMGLFGGIWLSYAAGAALGSLAQGRWHWGALLLPLLGLAAVTGVTQAWPFEVASAVEEKTKHA